MTTTSKTQDTIEVIGFAAGYLPAVVACIDVYIAAIGSVGRVFGIAVGWIPAGLAAGVAFFVGRYPWPVVAILLVLAESLRPASRHAQPHQCEIGRSPSVIALKPFGDAGPWRQFGNRRGLLFMGGYGLGTVAQ